jgi:CheY-like chemotaxis protein
MVLEDDLVTSVALCKRLRTGMPDLLVLSPHSLAEARLMLQEYTVNFFVLDINLPDGSGIDFILDVTTANPEATVVLITSTPLPEYRDQASAFGVVHFLEKPIGREALLELVRESRRALAARSQTETSLFNASLSRLTVLDIIQLKCLNGMTQAVVFRSPQHGSGLVYFQNGEIVHAETASFNGLAALSEIISWKTGRAEEMPGMQFPARTITGNWQSSLLSAAHTADEKAESTPAEKKEASP